MKPVCVSIALASALLCMPGCGLRSQAPQTRPPAPATVSKISFEDVAAASGIDFSLGFGDRSPLNVAETAGGGAAFLDFDGDQRLDVLLVGPQRVGLFRGEQDGTFRNVTEQSGLGQKAFWMGCAAADYDGDGDTDLLFTGYDRTALFENVGGRFRDVTRRSGVSAEGWTLSAVFADYDLDGRLDIYVTRYLEFNEKTPRICQVGRIYSACGPEVYDPQRGRLYRNLGAGKFLDVTQSVGLDGAAGKGWSALLTDLDGNSYPDLFVANDMLPCDFFLNRKGRFQSLGTAANLAYDANGHLQGAMGTDCADFNNDGRLDLLVTTYFTQPTSLYRNDGGGLFTEVGMESGLGMPTMPYVSFGAVLFDADNDGWQDAFIANGHVRNNIREHDAGQDYAQPLQFFRNEAGKFVEVSRGSGAPFQTPVVGRGVSAGDYDQDGRIDLLVCNLDGKALLLRNQTDGPGHWLRVRLQSSGENRAGLGAVVTVESADLKQIREVRTRGSVMSAQEGVAHFGLGSQSTAARVTVRWPGGKTTIRENAASDQEILISGP